MRGNNGLIEPPPDSFFEPVTVDEKFEEEFTFPKNCDGNSVSDDNIKIEYHTCRKWNALIYRFSQPMFRPSCQEYAQLQRTYELHRKFGVNTPPHKFESESIAIKIPQNSESLDDATLLRNVKEVNEGELEELLLKIYFLGGSISARSTIVVDDDGTPYAIDYGSLQDTFRRYSHNRESLKRIFNRMSWPTVAVELFEAKLFSLLAYFPEMVNNYHRNKMRGELIPYMYQNNSVPPQQTRVVPFTAVQHGLLVNIPQQWTKFNPLTIDIWDTTYTEYKKLRDLQCENNQK